MPNPSQVTSSNVNTELGKGNGTTLQLGNNWTRNLTTQSSGSVTYGKARWGINFPGGSMVNYRSGLQLYEKQYQINNILQISSSDIVSVYDDFTIVQAAAWIRLYSNGVMRLEANDAGDPGYSEHITWRTSGTSSEYTAQFNITSGSLSAGSDSTNTDLALSTDRSWYIITQYLQGSGGDNGDIKTADGNLIIKSGGTTLISRPVSLYAEATLGML